MAARRIFLVLLLIGVAFSSRAVAQTTDECEISVTTASIKRSKEGFKMFSKAKFEGEFRKYNNSPFFAWDSKLDVSFDVVTKGRNSVFFKTNVQTVGAESVGQRVNVAGTSYVIEGGYRRNHGLNTEFGFGVTHLSSHLSTDVISLLRRAELQGRAVPEIDGTDLNVAWGEIQHRFRNLPLVPEVVVRVQPVGIKFRAGIRKYDEPVYLKLKATLLRDEDHKLVVATTHEFGKKETFNTFALQWHLFLRGQNEGRFQPELRYIPGDKEHFHVGPNDGWHPRGLSWGFKVAFGSK